jgi:uncharacterized protein (TIGR03435 family)
MKKFLFLAVAFVTMAGSALAQDLTGTWQGTLTPPNGRELRTVIRITRDGAAMRGQLISIDQGPQPIPINPITLQGTTVKMTIPGIGGSYEGKLEPGGNSITGVVTQNGNSLPLNLTRATPQSAWAIPEPPPALTPMAETANPSFEVATIKPSDPNRPGKLFTVKGRQFMTINTTLADLINFSYGVHARQITNAPNWMETDKFDLTAQPDGPGQPSERQWKLMIQKLLTDRFGLKFHRDKKELSVYAITIAKSGHKLTKSEGNPNGLPSLLFRGLGNLPGMNASITDFANVLQSAVLDRPVVDQTGLAGRWDFQLRWTPDEFQFGGLGVRPPAPTGDAGAPPDIYTAFQEQLGLKLEGTKAPTEVFVIDAVSKPSEN